MAAKKSKIRARGAPATLRRVRESEGKAGASFPVPPSRLVLPSGYAETLREIKRRIGEERLRVVMSANSAMVLLYWDIGRMILERQRTEGWGAKVIDRLGWDLSQSYPDMRGLSASDFARSFKASFGVSCHRWLTDCRVERAKELLAATDAQLVDVSSQSGFGDQAAFTRTFHRLVGLSPGRWRREHKRVSR